MKKRNKLLSTAWATVTTSAILDAKNNGQNKLYKNVAKATIPVYFVVGFALAYKSLQKIPFMPRFLSGIISIPVGILSVILHIGAILFTSHKQRYIEVDEFGIVEEKNEIEVDVVDQVNDTNKFKE